MNGKDPLIQETQEFRIEESVEGFRLRNDVQFARLSQPMVKASTPHRATRAEKATSTSCISLKFASLLQLELFIFLSNPRGCPLHKHRYKVGVAQRTIL